MEFKKHEDEILELFITSLQEIRKKFRHWKGCPYRNSHVQQLAEAVLVQGDRRQGIIKRL